MTQPVKAGKTTTKLVTDRKRAAVLLAILIADRMVEQGTEDQIEEALTTLMEDGLLRGTVLVGKDGDETVWVRF